MKGFFFALLLVAFFTLFSSCGIVSNQLHRAVNLLRVPVRVSLVLPDLSPVQVGGQKANA
jgi:hypothetical protein